MESRKVKKDSNKGKEDFSLFDLFPLFIFPSPLSLTFLKDDNKVQCQEKNMLTREVGENLHSQQTHMCAKHQNFGVYL